MNNGFALNINKVFSIFDTDLNIKWIAKHAWEFLKNNIIEKILKRLESK
jgi:hypothetical protein